MILHELHRVAIFRPILWWNLLHYKHFSTHSTSSRNQITVIIRKMCKINWWNFHSPCAPRFLPNLHLKRPLSFESFLILQEWPTWYPILYFRTLFPMDYMYFDIDRYRFSNIENKALKNFRQCNFLNVKHISFDHLT